LNLIHMLDQRRDRKLEVPAIDLSGNATYQAVVSVQGFKFKAM
jgi:hypothetical protein